MLSLECVVKPRAPQDLFTDALHPLSLKLTRSDTPEVLQPTSAEVSFAQCDASSSEAQCSRHDHGSYCRRDLQGFLSHEPERTWIRRSFWKALPMLGV